MPSVDGLTITRMIYGENLQMPVIAQTVFAMLSDEQKAMEAGCDAYIVKPISIKVLSLLIQKLLSRS